jgi:hypothetical protein
MQILSRIAAILGLVIGFAALVPAASAGEVLASKALYATETGNPLLQRVDYKPCCYSYRTGQYYRYSTKTCWRVEGRIVDDRFCRGYDGWQGRDRWRDRDDRWRDPRWQDPRWNGGGHDPRWNGGGQGYQQLCCKRGRKEWWVQSVWECQNRRHGSIVHPSYCVRY